MGWMPAELSSPCLRDVCDPEIPEEIQGTISPSATTCGESTIRRLLNPSNHHASPHQPQKVWEELAKGRISLADDRIIDEIDVKWIVVELLREKLALKRRAADTWLFFWRQRKAERERQRHRDRSGSAPPRAGVSPAITFRDELIPEHLPRSDSFQREDTPYSEIPEELYPAPLSTTYRTTSMTDTVDDPYTPVTSHCKPGSTLPQELAPLRLPVPVSARAIQAVGPHPVGAGMTMEDMADLPFMSIDRANPPLPSVIVARRRPHAPSVSPPRDSDRRPASGRCGDNERVEAEQQRFSAAQTDGSRSPAAVGRLRSLVRHNRPRDSVDDDAWVYSDGEGDAEGGSASGGSETVPSPGGRTQPVSAKGKVATEEDLRFLAMLKEPEDALKAANLHHFTPRGLSPKRGNAAGDDVGGPGSRPLTPPSTTPTGRGRTAQEEDYKFMNWCQSQQGGAAGTGGGGTAGAARRPGGHRRKSSSSSLPACGGSSFGGEGVGGAANLTPPRRARGYCSPTPPTASSPTPGQRGRPSLAATPPPEASSSGSGGPSKSPAPTRTHARRKSDPDQLVARKDSGFFGKASRDRPAMIIPKVTPATHAERRHFPGRQSSGAKLFG